MLVRIWLMASVVVVLSLGLAVVSGCGRATGQPAVSMPPAVVTTAPVVSTDVPVYLDEIGRTTASEVVNIEPQVPGEEHGPFSGHWGLTAHMVRVIRGQQKLIVRKEEVLNVMRTLDLLYQSAAEGREVSGPEK